MNSIQYFFVLLFYSTIKTVLGHETMLNKIEKNIKLIHPMEHRYRQCMWINGVLTDPVACSQVQTKKTLYSNEYARGKAGLTFYRHQYRQKLSDNSKENKNTKASPDVNEAAPEISGSHQQLVSERNYYKYRADILIQELKGKVAGPKSEEAGDDD